MRAEDRAELGAKFGGDNRATFLRFTGRGCQCLAQPLDLAFVLLWWNKAAGDANALGVQHQGRADRDAGRDGIAAFDVHRPLRLPRVRGELLIPLVVSLPLLPCLSGWRYGRRASPAPWVHRDRRPSRSTRSPAAKALTSCPTGSCRSPRGPRARLGQSTGNRPPVAQRS